MSAAAGHGRNVPIRAIGRLAILRQRKDRSASESSSAQWRSSSRIRLGDASPSTNCSAAYSRVARACSGGCRTAFASLRRRKPSPRSAWSMMPNGRLDSAASPLPTLTRKPPVAACRARSSMVVFPRPASATMNRLRPRPSRAPDNRRSIAPSVPSRSQIGAWGMALLSLGNPRPFCPIGRGECPKDCPAQAGGRRAGRI